MLQLVMAVSRSAVSPNAQLQVMNLHVQATFDGSSPFISVQVAPASGPNKAAELVGGVSSFGLNGTIAHVILSISSFAVGAIQASIVIILAAILKLPHFDNLQISCRETNMLTFFDYPQ